MKETKVYVDELPESCSGCVCVDGFYCGITQKNIYYEFYEWTKPKDCPLKNLHEHDKELVTKVLEKAKSLIIKYDLLKDYQGCAGYFMLDKIIEQIQKEFEK